MARVNSSEIIQEIIRKLRLSPAAEPVPVEVLNKILPVFVVNPTPIVTEIHFREIVGGSAADGDIFQTPEHTDFYVTNVALGSTLTAGSNFNVVGEINGKSVVLGHFQRGALARQWLNNSHVYPHPIKLDRNSLVQVTNFSSVAVGERFTAIVYGYLDDR